MVKFNGLHLELTNKCYLKCPRCARTTFIEKFGVKAWDNQDLNFENLKTFLDVDITGISFVLCGNNGDPIYHPEFLEIVAWFKSKSATVDIFTNGSYKTQDWWSKLASLVDKNDSITFSIDGTPENFTEYRVNANWESIEMGLQTMIDSMACVTWKMIPFKFNENDIGQVENYALTLGVDQFIIMPSDRWVDNDPLKPSGNIGNRYISMIDWKYLNKTSAIDPECLRNNSVAFITAEGFYAPCCYITDWRFYYKSEFYKNKNIYDISKTTISKINSNKKTINFYNTLTETKLPVCTYNCPKL